MAEGLWKTHFTPTVDGLASMRIVSQARHVSQKPEETKALSSVPRTPFSWFLGNVHRVASTGGSPKVGYSGLVDVQVMGHGLCVRRSTYCITLLLGICQSGAFPAWLPTQDLSHRTRVATRAPGLGCQRA